MLWEDRVNPAGSCLYDLVLALWVGGISIFTFVVTPAIFRSFNRDMAGQIVGKLFPGYFLYNLVLSLLALGLLLIGSHASDVRYRLSLLLTVGAIVINLFVAFRLHPEIKAVKEAIHSFENSPPESPLRKKFTLLHAVSATLNLIVLADGVVLLLIRTGLKK
ncbi:MAG TPA: DUF4149 domain-containing protein [Nitrospiraceae bacterium]|jgi:hypothetical protein|nr:DUF4149 domain-containing protein [Nitrospiraceae bacterium]